LNSYAGNGERKNMSTKTSIKWRDKTVDSPGFHLYEDCFEVLENGTDAPVYLRLDGVPTELSTQPGGASVSVRLPREMAIALGLLQQTNKA
jgi:hypothetical protein